MLFKFTYKRDIIRGLEKANLMKKDKLREGAGERGISIAGIVGGSRKKGFSWHRN